MKKKFNFKEENSLNKEKRKKKVNLNIVSCFLNIFCQNKNSINENDSIQLKSVENSSISSKNNFFQDLSEKTTNNITEVSKLSFFYKQKSILNKHAQNTNLYEKNKIFILKNKYKRCIIAKISDKNFKIERKNLIENKKIFQERIKVDLIFKFIYKYYIKKLKFIHICFSK